MNENTDLILLSRLLNPGKFCQKRILLKNFSFIFIDDKSIHINIYTKM